MKLDLKFISVVIMSVFYVSVGISHFTNPFLYLQIIPPGLPYKLALVYISGFFEILGGIVVLVPKLRALARWGLISLLIAVFPANIYMAMNPNLFPDFSQALLYFRLSLQFVFIFWVLKATEMVRD